MNVQSVTQMRDPPLGIVRSRCAPKLHSQCATVSNTVEARVSGCFRGNRRHLTVFHTALDLPDCFTLCAYVRVQQCLMLSGHGKWEDRSFRLSRQTGVLRISIPKSATHLLSHLHS